MFRDLSSDANIPLSSPTKSDHSVTRRRLSVGEVDGRGVVDNNDHRGLVRALDMKSLLDLCPIPPIRKGRVSRRFSVGTNTDPDMHRRGSYCDKSIFALGHPFESAEHGIGFACKKGLKPISPNQDSFLVLRVEGQVSIYGVFDGHGRQGHDVSNFVKDYLPKLIVQDACFKTDVHSAILSGFAKTQELLEHETTLKNIDASASGTTCTIVVHCGSKLFVASVGDSRCVLAFPCPLTGELTCRDVSRDHKPEIPEERERIHRLGGVVIKPPHDVNHRVYVKGFRFPGLAMSRALGDLIGYHRAGISPIPEISQTDLFGDETLLLCSDGVWEFLSSAEAVALIQDCTLGVQSYMEAAENLCRVSWDKWIAEENGAVVDDITAIIVKLGATTPGTTTASQSRKSSLQTPPL